MKYKLKDIHFSYLLGSHKIKALNGVSLEIPSGSMTAFTGPSGSGKSTLLNLLGLIEPMQNGKLIFQNEDISTITEKEKNVIRKFNIGFIFQQFHLIPVLTAEENVAHFLEKQKLPKVVIKERTEEMLNAVGLWEHRMKKPLQLSGGQRQRVAIARAMAKRPDVIIGDEVTASLDQKTGKEIVLLLEKLVKENNQTVILTTHDPMVEKFADVKFHIQDGKLL